MKVVVRFSFTLLFVTCCCFGQGNGRDIQRVNTYLKNLKYMAVEFVQSSSLPKPIDCYGRLYICKENKKNRAEIKYFDHRYRDISICDSVLTTVDMKTGKRNSYSVPKNSIYSILKGEIDLSKKNCSLKDVSKNTMEVTVSISQESYIILSFSRYENGNIKGLDGWTVNESNGNKIHLCFVKGTFFVNDKTRIPKGMF
jgi:hypothetical protein